MLTLNLESKIAGLVVLLIIAVYGVQAAIDYSAQVAQAEARCQEQAATIADTLRFSVAESVRAADRELLDGIARDIVDANPEINQLTIVAADGATLASAVKDRTRSDLNSVTAAVLDGETMLATINVGFLTGPLQERLRTSLRDKGLTALLVIGVAMLFAILLSRRVTRPLAALTAAAERVAAGDLTQQVAVRGGDEIALLGRTFNRMTENLARSHGELNHANSSLAEKVRELTTLFDINRLIGRSTEVREVLHLTMELITTGFGVEMAALLLRQADGQFRIVEQGGLDPATVAAHALDPEQGAVAGVVMLGEPLLVEQPATAPELLAGFNDAERARIGSVLLIPLKTAQQTPGLLTVYRVTGGGVPGEELRHLFTLIGSLIAPLVHLSLLSEEKQAAVANPFTPLAERLERELARARKFGMPLSIALVRAERFSACCAAASYPTGTRLFEQLQQAFLPAVPSAESVIRFGLSSFAVIQAGKDAAETRQQLGGVLAAAQAHQPALAGLGATVQVVSFPADADEALALLDKAGA